MNIRDMGFYERESFLRHLKDGFYLWDYCYNKDGELFAQEAEICGGEIWFVYYDKKGNLYESREFPVISEYDSLSTGDLCTIPHGTLCVVEYENKYGDVKTRCEWK